MPDFALSLGVAAALAAAPAPADFAAGPHIAEFRAFATSEGDSVWPGYGQAAFGFLLIEPSRETLLCRAIVPEGFRSAGIDPASGCSQYRRRRSGLPGGLLAAMPLFGPPSVIVMGTPQSTGRTPAAWLRTIAHEHFHNFQYALPSYFARLQALDLHGGDETGMWVLNYAFPYDDAAVNAAFEAASATLADAVEARATPGFLAAFDRYLAARGALAEAAGERHWRYLELQLWQEGVARWSEIRLGKYYPRADVRDSAAKLEQATIAGLRTARLSEKKREVVYAHGAAEAMLMQACDHQWRAAYPAALALGPLLGAARARCASRFPA